MEVVWNHLAAKNSTSMDIELSLDGGYTFPIKLISNTPNDGEVYITVPEKIETKEGRLKIVADNSIYFSICSCRKRRFFICHFQLFQSSSGVDCQ